MLIDERTWSNKDRKDEQRIGSHFVVRMLSAVVGRCFTLNLGQEWCRRIYVVEWTEGSVLKEKYSPDQYPSQKHILPTLTCQDMEQQRYFITQKSTKSIGHVTSI
jgi:hypothetical protein